VVWFDTLAHGGCFTDLDSDGKMEIFGGFCHPSYQYTSVHKDTPGGALIWENEGDNRYVPIFLDYPFTWGGYRTFGDFDGDGKKEWFQATGEYRDSVVSAVIWECAGDNKYKVVWEERRRWINVYDVWKGNDTDKDGKPEIFILAESPGLCMYEGIGDDAYELIPIDTTVPTGKLVEGRSTCGDVDGDGVEEVILSLGTKIIVYKAMGNNQYERVWEWKNDMGKYPGMATGVAVCHDFNKNGYEEIIISSEGKTSIFEIDPTSGIVSNLPILKSFNLSISPNPAKKSTVISLQLPVKEIINLKVYDATGRLIKTLVKAQSLEPKTYTIKWDGRDDKGNSLPSGVYFIRLETEGITKTEKVILTR